MGSEWYDMYAERYGGYIKGWTGSIEGESGEDLFVEKLLQRIDGTSVVLDAGCGDGLFALGVAQHAAQVVGFDFSPGMIAAANRLAGEHRADNVQFLYATTKADLPFADEAFDLVYSRRGPTSICHHPRILKPGGIIMGIHFPDTRDIIVERLAANGFVTAEFQVCRAVQVLPTREDFARWLSRIPGNPDYTEPGREAELTEKLREFDVGEDGIRVPHDRLIWQAARPAY